MQGRFDTREYRTFMNICFNGFPTETGSWTRRPGTKHLGTTRRGLAGRNVSFAFKAGQPIVLEFTDLHIRAWNGTQLVMTDDGQFVTDISTANPAVVTTQSAHGWSTANEVQFQLPGALCPLLQNRQFLITVIDATHFSLQDDLSDANIDGSTLGWAPGPSPVQVTRVLDVGSLYVAGTSNSWENLRSVQTETTAVLLNGAVPHQLVAAVGNPYPTLTWTQIVFLDGPYLDPVAGSIMTPSATSGTITFTQAGPAVNGGTGFSSADVGRSVRFFSEPKPWPGAGTGLAGDIVSFGGGYWIQQVNATTTPPGYIGAFVAPVNGEAAQAAVLPSFSTNANSSATPQWLPLTVTAAAAWCWGTIASVLNATQITVSNLSRPLVAVTAINTWRLGVYGGPNGYPTCGVYHEGRLWLSGAIDNRVDASCSNDPYNFAPTLVDGTVLDSSAIDATFNADDVNPIFWMVSDDQGIVCGTQGGEWLISASTSNSAITAANIQAHRKTKNGCANIEPRRTEHTLVVVQKFKRKILEFFADVFSGRFAAPDLSQNWKHITAPYVQELAYQQELVPIVWFRLGDGTFGGMTYKRDSLMSSQGPSFSAGHRHRLGSGWSVKSIATGSNATGTLDALTMVTYDASTNIYHVEQISDLFQEGSQKSKAWFVDAGVFPSSAQLTSVGGVPVYQLNGLWHLNGYTATAYIGGLDCGDFPVVNGTMNVTLEQPQSLLTALQIQTWQNSGGVDIAVGFNFTSQGQIVRPATAQESGARNGPALGKVRRSHLGSLLFQDAAGVSIGTDFSTMNPCLFKSPGGSVNLTPFQMFSGVYKSTIKDSNTFDSQPCWQISRPLPCTVVAVQAFLDTEDE